jgi:hypothetical protein
MSGPKRECDRHHAFCGAITVSNNRNVQLAQWWRERNRFGKRSDIAGSPERRHYLSPMGELKNVD